MQLENRKMAVTVIVFLVTLLAVINPLQDVGDGYIDNAFKRALAGYAIARGLNGVISVAQGTELAIQPAGVGINFTPGEILDPVNDLVERFSWIMLLATSSLGVQKILMSMSAWYGVLVAVIVAAWLLMCVYWVKGLATPLVRTIITRFFLLMLILRFMMPMVALANEWVYRAFLSEQYNSASEQLEQARENIGAINEELKRERHTESSGLVDKAVEFYRSAVKQIDFDKRLERYQGAAEEISLNTINLIVVFMMQTLVFPLLFLWMVYMIIRRVFAIG